MRKLLIKLLGGYTEAEMVRQSQPQFVEGIEFYGEGGFPLNEHPQPMNIPAGKYEPAGQTYFKRHIMERFMDKDEMRKFHHDYARRTRRNNLPESIKTYRAEVIKRMMPYPDYYQFNQKYQDAKVPTALNLHYGNKLKELVREVVKEEMQI